jgi:hypothetical protein
MKSLLLTKDAGMQTLDARLLTKDAGVHLIDAGLQRELDEVAFAYRKLSNPKQGSEKG